MDVRIVILPNGEIGLYTESGDFESGKAKIAQLLRILEAEGLTFSEVGKTEQHRHSEIEQRLHNEQRAQSQGGK